MITKLALAAVAILSLMGLACPASAEEPEFPEKVVVLLAEKPNPETHLIRLQFFIRDGKSILPVFSSVEALERSAKSEITNPVYRFARAALLSILHGHETLVLDIKPGEERIFNAGELKQRYQDEIADFESKQPGTTEGGEV